MAEENEKKPEFVVHKKQQDATPATPEKKRVVVVKRKTNQNQNQNSQKPSEQNQKKDGVHIVVKKKRVQGGNLGG